MGVAQRRYCTYVERALYAEVSSSVTLVLKRVVLGGLEGLQPSWRDRAPGTPKAVSRSLHLSHLESLH